MAEQDEDMVDITETVDGCAASLTYENTLLCKQTFDLLDAMSALELMDPKMDCCEIPLSMARGGPAVSLEDEDVVPPRPLPTGLEDSVAQLPWKDLTMEDASLIAVEALTRLESMLSGSSVAESIYSCLYTHNAVLEDMKSSIEEGDATPAQRAVFAVSLALVAIGKIVRDIILRADIYEEEDFSVQNCGLEPYPGILTVESYSGIENGMECTKGVEEGRKAELALQFQLEFLKCCSSMSATTPDNVVSIAETTKRNIKSGTEKLEELEALLMEHRESETVPSPLSRRCFDPFIYRPLVGNTPIRKVVFRKPLESISILSTILSEIGSNVCEILLCGSTLSQVRRMLSRFSKRPVNILSRSLMVLNLYFEDKFLGQYDLQYLVSAEMKQLLGAPDALLAGKYGQALLARMAKPVYDMLKLFLINKNRQQAYLNAAMIPDWSSLQKEARAVDLNYCMEHQLPPNSPPFFSHYILYNLVRLMDHYIALGLELGLHVGHHDLAVAYWYRDVLLSSLINTLTAMQKTKMDARQKIEEETKPSKGKKKKGKKGADETAPTKEDLEDNFDLMIFMLKRALCRGLARFLAALCQADLLSPESFEFTSYEIRFVKRFQPFACVVTPPPLAYKDFLIGSDFSKVKQSDLLKATAESFTNAKATVDGLLGNKQVDVNDMSTSEDELRSLAKVCVGNSVYLMKLTRQINDGGSANGTVEFDFKAHDEFCIIKLV